MEDVRLAFVRISSLHFIRGRKDLRHAFEYFPERQVYVAITPAVPALFLWIVFHFRVVMWCASAIVAQMAGAAFSSSV